MKKFLLAVLVLSPVFFFSCNSGGGDPKAVLSQFLEALSKKDIATARKLSTEDSKSLIDMMEMAMKNDKGQKPDDKFDPKKMEFGEPKIEGDKATISVKEKESQESLNFTLKKEKGDWKVAFDKATMMGNAMEKMDEKGINASDSIKKAMDELKNIDVDSLKRGIQEGMKALDSAH